MSVNSRRKGNKFETDLVKFFQQLGWKECVTSRSESKRLDDKGVDLCYTDPFQVQAKAWKSAPSYHQVLSNMVRTKGKFNILIHKRPHKGSVVVMHLDDFEELVKLMIKAGVIKCT